MKEAFEENYQKTKNNTYIFCGKDVIINIKV